MSDITSINDIIPFWFKLGVVLASTVFCLVQIFRLIKVFIDWLRGRF
jgi:hypothetical protein